MVSTKSPRKGSLQYWPRKRVNKFLPSVNWKVIDSGKNLKGFTHDFNQNKPVFHLALAQFKLSNSQGF